MSAFETAYCRLCAELKTKAKQINLLYREDMRITISEKLLTFNINIALNNLSDDNLPSTVCISCINSLNNAYDFVIQTNRAQEILGDLVLNKNIKHEKSNSDSDDNYESTTDFDKSCDLNIKYESGNEVDTEKDLESTSKLKNRKDDVVNEIDLPLSQLKLTWKDYNWVCAYCDTQFPTIEELKSHSIQIHQCCNPYRCTDCNYRKLKLDSFITHVKRHRNYLKLSCYKCHKKFAKASHVRGHSRVHVNTKYVCTGCNETFKKKEELLKHNQAYNRDLRLRNLPPLPVKSLKDSLTCPICQKLFKHKGTLTNHLLIHTERKREHTCEKCGKRFLSKQNLAGHMMLHDDIRPFPCEICKSRFRTQAQLRLHVGIHDGIKPFECDQCGRCFRLRKQLINHNIVHTDALPYICSYCSKGFKFKSILDQHVRQHTGVKPYSCQYCEREFTNWPNYNKHMKRRHATNMAKKKRTPQGVYPIDPVTGELKKYEETNHTNEWKQQLLESRRKPGRPKQNLNEDNIHIHLSDNNIEINHNPTDFPT